jgi:hypothetical protein
VGHESIPIIYTQSTSAPQPHASRLPILNSVETEIHQNQIEKTIQHTLQPSIPPAERTDEMRILSVANVPSNDATEWKK